MVAMPLRFPFLLSGTFFFEIREAAKVVPCIVLPPQGQKVLPKGFEIKAGQDIPIFCKYSPALSVFFVSPTPAVPHFKKWVGN